MLFRSGRRIFVNLSVEENLRLGAFLMRRSPHEVNLRRDEVFARLPRLFERRHQLAGTLSGGEQQMLAIGRALMTRPKLLALDEPSMGLAPLLVQAIFATLAEVRRAGTAVLLVEQNARQALRLADRGYVLETGAIVLEDTAQGLARNPRVQAAYLGGEPEVAL